MGNGWGKRWLAMLAGLVLSGLGPGNGQAADPPTVAAPGLTFTLLAPAQTHAPAQMSPIEAPLEPVLLTRSFLDDFDRFEPGLGPWKHHFDHGPPEEWWARTLTSNQEQQLYVDPGFRGSAPTPLGLNPFSAEQGRLTITGAPIPLDLQPALNGYRFGSGLLSSEGAFAQRYGYFEARLKFPVGQGLWSAFWLLPPRRLAADPARTWPPEIDVVEHLGGSPEEVFTTVHWDVAPDHQKSGMGHRLATASEGFNTYGVLWRERTTAFFINRQPVSVIETKPNHHVAMFLLLNLAVGGEWPGPVDPAVLPAALEIEWVAAYTVAE